MVVYISKQLFSACLLLHFIPPEGLYHLRTCLLSVNITTVMQGAAATYKLCLSGCICVPSAFKTTNGRRTETQRNTAAAAALLMLKGAHQLLRFA